MLTPVQSKALATLARAMQRDLENWIVDPDRLTVDSQQLLQRHNLSVFSDTQQVAIDRALVFVMDLLLTDPVKLRVAYLYLMRNVTDSLEIQ